MTKAPLIITGLILVLTAALIGGGIFWMIRVRGASPPPTALLTSSPESAVTSTPANAQRAVLPETKRPKSLPEPFVLTGIVEGAGKPYAVINGAILGVGEQINGATLLSIADGAVTMRLLNGKELQLHLSQ